VLPVTVRPLAVVSHLHTMDDTLTCWGPTSSNATSI
jgi:hypothetical protein